MNKEEMEEIIDLISKDSNVIKAQKIAENWNHIKWFTEWNFWNDLAAIISKEFTVSDVLKYNDGKLNSVIHQFRNRNPWYGIVFKIGEYSGFDLMIFIERGTENLYYGLIAFKNNERQNISLSIFEDLIKATKEFSEWGGTDTWIGGNYIHPEINFEAFSNQETIRLINSDFRTNSIINIWNQIKKYTLEIDRLISK